MPLKRKTTKLARRSFLSRGGGYAYVPQQDRRVVNLASLLELYMSDAVIQRAVHKRATDLVAGGIELDGADDSIKTDVLNWLESTVRYKGVLSNAIRDAFVFGNGFLEKVYSNDDAPSNEPSSGDSLIELAPVSPKQITIVEDDDVESDTYGRVVGYHVRPAMPHSTFSMQPILSVPLSKLGMLQEGRMIHPSRIIHVKFSSLSDSNVGMSLLEPAYNILKSKIEADKVLGTIVVRFAKPIVKAIIENGTPEEIRNLGRLLFNMNKRAEDVQYLVTDDAVKELSILGASGQVLNPETYYKVMLDNICIALGIPRPLLIGAEAGSISGSDLNLISYFQSLQSDQETVLTPIIRDLISSFLETRNEQLDVSVKIKWKQWFTDEIALFKSTFMNTQSAISAYGAGLITKNEARGMINLDNVSDGEQFIEPDKKSITPKGFGDVASILPADSPKREG